MSNYYKESLHADRLMKCYEIGSPRIQQFLNAEIEFVQKKIEQSDWVLDLGCGYGRVALQLKAFSLRTVGIDISEENIEKAKELNKGDISCEFHVMSATDLHFADETFDLVICIQNGISAFHVPPEDLLREAIRVCKKGGKILFSSYAQEFWNERVKWFQQQADQGLLGEIDYSKTADGRIVCKDGFTASTYSKEDFTKLLSSLQIKGHFHLIDKSSLFCEIRR